LIEICIIEGRENEETEREGKENREKNKIYSEKKERAS